MKHVRFHRWDVKSVIYSKKLGFFGGFLESCLSNVRLCAVHVSETPDIINKRPLHRLQSTRSDRDLYLHCNDEVSQTSTDCQNPFWWWGLFPEHFVFWFTPFIKKALLVCFVWWLIEIRTKSLFGVRMDYNVDAWRLTFFQLFPASLVLCSRLGNCTVMLVYKWWRMDYQILWHLVVKTLKSVVLIV